ncbi:MAG: hypothetical protein P1S59_05290 [bacterium]|nr:hypothetical protein [bacterium]
MGKVEYRKREFIFTLPPSPFILPFLQGFQVRVRYKARVLRDTGGVYGTYGEDFRRAITQ